MTVELTTDEYNKLIGVDDSYKAPEHLMKTLANKTEREELFKVFLETFNYDVTYDWFANYFQEEHSDRKNKKQDFTPTSISNLVSSLIGDTSNSDGLFYEPCSGSGAMTIARWQSDRIQHSPFEYKPSWYIYFCEETSDRVVPFLLFNLAIRGMNAVVTHCDVLSRKAKGSFFIQNEKDDHLQFSNIYRLPYNDSTAKELAVTWSEEKYAEFDKVGGFPAHLGGNEFLERVKSND